MKKLIPLLLTVVLSGCSISDEATFTAEYKKLYEDLYTVEIPEQYELVMVMLAISEIGQTDSSFIEMRTDYHKEVIQHFKPYENHKIIRKINRKVRKPEHTMSYLNAILYRQNVLGYALNNKDQIVYKNILPRLYAFPFIRNPVNKHQKHINDFIKVSEFRKFYAAHKPYYNSLIRDYKKNVPLDKMVQWLNQKFQAIKYNNYNVIASPLIRSPNYTRRFYDSTYKQAIMSVGSLKEWNKQNPATSHRSLFTEIDHNYVNPVSEKYRERIDEAFNDLDQWRQEGNLTKAYDSPYKTFNPT